MELFDSICDILKTLSGMEHIQPENTLLEDLALDSLNMITLLLEIEDVFQIELTESDLNPYDFVTVADVEKLVRKYKNVQEPSAKI